MRPPLSRRQFLAASAAAALAGPALGADGEAPHRERVACQLEMDRHEDRPLALERGDGLATCAGDVRAGVAPLLLVDAHAQASHASPQRPHQKPHHLHQRGPIDPSRLETEKRVQWRRFGDNHDAGQCAQEPGYQGRSASREVKDHARRLEREAGRNVEVMWLLARLAPDHKTIADFRKDNGPGIKKVCARFVEVCAARWGCSRQPASPSSSQCCAARAVWCQTNAGPFGLRKGSRRRRAGNQPDWSTR